MPTRTTDAAASDPTKEQTMPTTDPPLDVRTEPPARRHDLHASAEPDDSPGGLAMFLIFTAAVLIVTGAVVLVALVGSWWILGVAFAIHVLMTATVIATIVLVMDGRAGAATERDPVDSHRAEPRAPAPTRPAAAL